MLFSNLVPENDFRIPFMLGLLRSFGVSVSTRSFGVFRYQLEASGCFDVNSKIIVLDETGFLEALGDPLNGSFVHIQVLQTIKYSFCHNPHFQ